jgi:periplasmic copper chaperone A
MTMKRSIGLLAGLSLSVLPALARAHVSIASGPGFANTTQEVTFAVGHGCAGADTYKIRVEIPPDVTAVRAMRSDFGKPAIEKDAAGAVTAVSWQKPEAEALDGDFAYYKLVLRLRVPNKPFTTSYFKVHQTCRAADGTLSTVVWGMLPTDPVVDGGADEPAAALNVLPARRPGWNKYTVAQAVPDVATLFGDAQIVWKGSAAYSANPTTAELIAATAGVTALTALAANDEIWVKY